MQQTAAGGTATETENPHDLRGQTGSAGAGSTPRRTAAENETLVITTIQRHADSLLRVARRNSLCEDDAADAYQRAMEIFVRRVDRLESATVERWLCRVVRHEAMAVREQRQCSAAGSGLEPDWLEARHAASPEDRVVEMEAMAHAAEALGTLKPAELQALSLQAAGRSYSQIAERSGWTQTKVNRCLVEGRRRFAARKAAIDTGQECDRWRAALAALVDGRASARELSAVRPHLRNCQACQAHVRALYRDGAHVQGLVPAGLGVEGLDHVTGGRLTGWLSRIHDAVGLHVQERLTAQMITVQTAADTVSGAKVAAVAASAAAIAGGGAAVVQQGGAPPPKQSAARTHRTAPPAAARPAPPRRRTVAAQAPGGSATQRSTSTSTSAARPPSAGRAPNRRTTRMASRPARSTTRTEFSGGHVAARPAGAHTVSARASAAAAVPQRRAAPASALGGEFSAGGSSTPAPTAGAEFVP